MVKHTSSILYLSKTSAHILRLQKVEFIQTSVQMIPFTGNLVIVLHLSGIQIGADAHEMFYK